ncbi:bifunctional diaminohydroxyphosphoribosylaminopyrimidine deaminase/5-amino-6-(5-phosphoribosylamino)uracil reductase RibD [Bacillus sp. A301a_S52]|jgi:diaminohydroxyphosphoribosylaminopyrimidine deaminase/5-amino-6-(5-phosphoribosylamino)uracil reductase|nr:bifunctional diaminohydroxyphosphoribosylaminopyrimidine deaminase/5-amino-6-(5-phosphoribosylamino)uracil reductase RibD [Bacillus sp. A301a_S52]
METDYMELAIQMAAKTKGQTVPNPVVGCVIVKDSEIVGLGAHLKAGDPHAERHALAMAGEKAKEAVMYVTLEPCSHYGKTPPCADAIIEAGISKVFIASLDPNPKVSGKGIAKLKQAGIAIETGAHKAEADALNKEFFHYIRTSKPYVTLKTASSIDGKIATSSGESQWITGEEARKDSHRLRHENDAILVGVETIIQDNPMLTVRLSKGGHHPIRIILDSTLRIPLKSHVVTNTQADTWIVTTQRANQETKEALEQAGVTIFTVAGDTIEIAELLTIIGKQQVSSLLVEGGGTVNDSFLRAGEFQCLIKYMAPMIIGGEQARSSFSGKGFSNLSDVPHLDLVNMELIGQDVKFVFYKREE